MGGAFHKRQQESMCFSYTLKVKFNSGVTSPDLTFNRILVGKNNSNSQHWSFFFLPLCQSRSIQCQVQIDGLSARLMASAHKEVASTTQAQRFCGKSLSLSNLLCLSLTTQPEKDEIYLTIKSFFTPARPLITSSLTDRYKPINPDTHKK